jgi:hypothetical protein
MSLPLLCRAYQEYGAFGVERKRVAIMEEVARKPKAIQEELNQHLAALNRSWQRYGDIVDGYIGFDSTRARADAIRLALDEYYDEDRWLAECGYPWRSLKFDLATRTYSLPDEKPVGNEGPKLF